MDEKAKQPEQGFKGKLVAHNDMKTATKDWTKEFGPAAKGSWTRKSICASTQKITCGARHG